MTTTPARTSTKSNCGHTSCSWTFVCCNATQLGNSANTSFY